jgi:hypothetical protein
MQVNEYTRDSMYNALFTTSSKYSSQEVFNTLLTRMHMHGMRSEYVHDMQNYYANLHMSMWCDFLAYAYNDTMRRYSIDTAFAIYGTTGTVHTTLWKDYFTYDKSAEEAKLRLSNYNHYDAEKLTLVAYVAQQYQYIALKDAQDSTSTRMYIWCVDQQGKLK